MPKPEKWLILDNNTGLYISFYSFTLANCGWDVSLNAIDFQTELAANNAIAEWNLGEQSRFIGSNPPPH